MIEVKIICVMTTLLINNRTIESNTAFSYAYEQACDDIQLCEVLSPISVLLVFSINPDRRVLQEERKPGP